MLWFEILSVSIGIIYFVLNVFIDSFIFFKVELVVKVFRIGMRWESFFLVESFVVFGWVDWVLMLIKFVFLVVIEWVCVIVFFIVMNLLKNYFII